MSNLQTSQGAILIVGQPVSGAEGLAAVLTGAGYQIHSVAHKQQALEAIQTSPPDLILIQDISPDQDSLELGEQLRVVPGMRHTPVLFTLAEDKVDDRVQVLALGAADYVTSPFHNGEVLGRVATLLATETARQQRHELESRLAREIAQRRAAEELVRQGELWGQSLVENLQDVIYTADADGTVTYVSPAIERLLGYTPAELVGRSLRQTVHNDDLALLEQALQDLLKGRQAANEYRLLTRSGEVRWIRTSSRPSIEEGRVAGVQGVLSDITERKLVEDQLRQQNEFLTLVLESLTHPFYVVDAHDYSIHIANSAAQTEALGGRATCYALAHRRTEPCTGTEHPCPLRAIKRSKKPVTVEHLHYQADGEPRIFQVRGYPLFDRAGNVDRIIEYTLDITEQRQAEEALRESEARWRSVAQNSPDHVIILDTDLRIEFVNRASPGLDIEALIGVPLHTLASEEDQSRVRSALEGVLQTGGPSRYETTFAAPDGSTIYYESRVVPRLVNGQIVGLTVNARDVTRYKQTEKFLLEAKEAADQARREEQDRRREADRRRRVAESLAGVLAALNSDQDVARVLDHIAVQAGQLLESQAVFIYSLHAPEGILDIQATEGLPDPQSGEIEEVFGQEALEQAVATRRPSVLPEVPPHADGPYRAVLAVPILVKDEVYGGIGLYYAQPQEFSAEQVELATIFGDQVALAVENARLRKESEQAAAAAERNRLARDLHDSVTQALFSASLVAEVLPQVWQRDPQEAQEGLQELRLLTRGALAEMRTMLLELRPTALLETKLDDLLWQVTEAITSRVQLISTCNIEPVPPLPPDVHVTFYRVAQEALHNVVRHAAASHVAVGLRASPPMPVEGADAWQGQVILHVGDDGRGFDPGHTLPDHLGLSIMRERATGIGATLNIVSEPDRGTQITLVWRTA